MGGEQDVMNRSLFKVDPRFALLSQKCHLTTRSNAPVCCWCPPRVALTNFPLLRAFPEQPLGLGAECLGSLGMSSALSIPALHSAWAAGGTECMEELSLQENPQLLWEQRHSLGCRRLCSHSGSEGSLTGTFLTWIGSTLVN